MNDPIDQHLSTLFARERDALAATAKQVPALAVWRSARKTASARAARHARRSLLVGLTVIAAGALTLAWIHPEALARTVGPLVLLLPMFAHALGANAVTRNDGGP